MPDSYGRRIQLLKIKYYINPSDINIDANAESPHNTEICAGSVFPVKYDVRHRIRDGSGGGLYSGYLKAYIALPPI